MTLARKLAERCELIPLEHGGGHWTDRQTGLSFIWRGGHGVNVFAPLGAGGLAGERANIDVFSVGDFIQSAATLDEVRQGILDYLDQLPK